MKNVCPRRSAVAAILTALLLTQLSAAPVDHTIGPEGLRIRGVGPDNPIIYDNDWWWDTPDKNYLYTLASLGKARLVGQIASRDLWDAAKGYHYSIEDSLKEARKWTEMARQSGLKNLPNPAQGADRVFVRPITGRIEDTVPRPCEGAYLIVAEARKASPEKPLLIFVGGPLNTVANALLTDPSITNRIIVFMTDIRGYNGQDPWANWIVSKWAPLVNFGAEYWWPQRPQPPVLPIDRCRQLPDCELNRDLTGLAQKFWDRSTRQEKPDRDDGFADGAPVFLPFQPRTWLGVRRLRAEEVFQPKETTERQYDYLDATQCDFGLMTEEFFRIVGNPDAYARK
ncbi:MAG: hypothetical protein ACYC23_15880 [Limisphaerales bacterium]